MMSSHQFLTLVGLYNSVMINYDGDCYGGFVVTCYKFAQFLFEANICMFLQSKFYLFVCGNKAAFKKPEIFTSIFHVFSRLKVTDTVKK